MSHRKHILILGILAVASITAAATDFPTLNEPYLGQQPPGLVPMPFAEGEVHFNHSSISMTPDGAEIYWAERHSGTLPSRVYFSRRLDEGWSEPAPLFVDCMSHGDCPVVSPDGQRLFLNSVHPLVPGERERERLWVSERVEDHWSPPVPLAETVNAYGLHWQCSVDAEGDLYFGAIPPHGGSDDGIYVAQWNGSEFLPPVAMQTNTTLDETTPYMAPDRGYLLISRIDAQGGHIAVSFHSEDGSWTEPSPLDLGDVSYPVCPYVSPDGNYLFVLSGAIVYWVDAQIIETVRPQVDGGEQSSE